MGAKTMKALTRKFISYKIVVHILFAVKDVFPKDLEHMQQEPTLCN